jgi:signal transduction histidine kinase
VNLWNYHSVTSQQDEALTRLMEIEDQQMPFSSRRGALPFDDWSHFSPEVQYSLRFFSVHYDTNGIVSRVNQDYIASISESDAETYADAVLESGKAHGYESGYRYLVSTTEDETVVLFLNSEREIQTMRSLLWITLAIAAVCLAVVFGLVVLFSQRAITPYLKNMEAQKQFITNAGHELKTPLAGIRLLTDSILQTDNMDPDTTKEFVTDIGREAERLSRITENLLRLTRLDGGVVQAAYPVAVGPVLQRVERMLGMVAEEKGVTISGSASEEAVAWATDDDVHQILYNLMENAIKYSAAENGFVRAEASVRDGQVVITVTDNGIGIPNEDLPHVFDRFYRVDKMRSREVGGTGLGLSIVKDTIENRGGSIQAGHGADGVGTVFTVTLPLAKREEELCEE